MEKPGTDSGVTGAIVRRFLPEGTREGDLGRLADLLEESARAMDRRHSHAQALLGNTDLLFRVPLEFPPGGRTGTTPRTRRDDNGDGRGSSSDVDSGDTSVGSEEPPLEPAAPTVGVVDRVRRQPPEGLSVAPADEGTGIASVVTRADGTKASYRLMDDPWPPTLAVVDRVGTSEEVALALLDLRAQGGAIEQVGDVMLFLTSGDIERVRVAREDGQDVTAAALELPDVRSVLGVLRDAGHRFVGAAVDRAEIETILDAPVSDLDLTVGGHLISVDLQSEGRADPSGSATRAPPRTGWVVGGLRELRNPRGTR